MARDCQHWFVFDRGNTPPRCPAPGHARILGLGGSFSVCFGHLGMVVERVVALTRERRPDMGNTVFVDNVADVIATRRIATIRIKLEPRS